MVDHEGGPVLGQKASCAFASWLQACRSSVVQGGVLRKSTASTKYRLRAPRLQVEGLDEALEDLVAQGLRVDRLQRGRKRS